MTATKAPLSELPADLVERVRNLPSAQLDALRELVDGERAAEAEYNRELWAEIRSRLDAYDRGEMKAYDWKESVARVEAKLRAAFPGAVQ